MFMTAETLDDLLLKVYRRLLRGKSSITPSKGECSDLHGVLLQIRNPRARVSRTEQRSTLFSCLGEFLWYVAGSNELSFIQYYISRYDEFSDDLSTVHGAYGPRLFNMRGVDQVRNVIEKLNRNNDTRRAVIQLFNAEDLGCDVAVGRKDIPCTCTMQFSLRARQLHMFVTMRSNDAYLGLPHDVFAFTMLQEIVARAVGAELGTYKHAVGSLHLYSKNTDQATKYVDEGLQERIAMPSMPVGDPQPALSALVEAEREIRLGQAVNVSQFEPYWADLVRLLLIQRHLKNKTPNSSRSIRALAKKMSTANYDACIQQRVRKSQPAPGPAEPIGLLFTPAELDAGMASLNTPADA
ncbi:thymidylate synthase [Ralstonia pseudosolanacearum]|uniref:thymidylate synthase n=1 Tax=Ralstonia pseudosolanacearum TaxID=1310165 RepID=UPI001FF8758B|nr:thymidylate synthase [Ralstonia pseudosolanacearum]